jgi:hypothetical protein
MINKSAVPRFLPPAAKPKRFWWDETIVPVGTTKLEVLLISDGDALTGLWFGDTHPGTPAGS